MTADPSSIPGHGDEPALFRRGLDLFNSGEFFEAHEVWEALWHAASGQRKLFYQGLIQCAVALEHLRRGNPRGALRVLASARTKFRTLPDMYLGIHIPRLLGALEAFLAPLHTLPHDRLTLGSPRGQHLPLSLDQAPRIALIPMP
jgi:hypothetical protein